MREYLTGHHAANEIRMRSERWAHAFAVVEGDTDARFFRRFLFQANGDGLVPAHGRDNVLQCLVILAGEEQFADRVVGIVDRDFWSLDEGRPPALAGLMLTDGRDLESMVLRSPALARLLDGYGSEEKLQALRRRGQSAEQLLVAAGVQIGLLRWLNERERRASADDADDEQALTRDGTRLRLDFNRLDFAKWTDKSTLVVDEQRLIRAIASHSRQALHEDRVTHALAALRARASVEEYDDWDLCCGHDLIELLKLGLRKLFGTCSTSRVDGLERVLLQSVYHEAEFMQSSLWATLKQWQSEHPRAHLLPATPEQRRENRTEFDRENKSQAAKTTYR